MELSGYPPHIILKMETTFHELKQKDVVNLSDGKNMGRVCDLKFTFPENNVLGFTVTGGRGFRFNRQEIFIPINCVVKIGEDAVLINFGKKEEPPQKPNRPPAHGNPPPPPNRPPECPPFNCPPFNCPPDSPPHNCDRRSFDEYE